MSSCAWIRGTARVPEFELKVIEEDETTRLYVNHEGILMRELKKHTDTEHAPVREVSRGKPGGVRNLRR